MFNTDSAARFRDFAMGLAAIALAAWSGALAFTTLREERNARLVEIGVSVLRVDPEKEKQVGAAREWALDLIDANAGRVKFTKAARDEHLRNPLVITGSGQFEESPDTASG